MRADFIRAFFRGHLTLTEQTLKVALKSMLEKRLDEYNVRLMRLKCTTEGIQMQLVGNQFGTELVTFLNIRIPFFVLDGNTHRVDFRIGDTDMRREELSSIVGALAVQFIQNLLHAQLSYTVLGAALQFRSPNEMTLDLGRVEAFMRYSSVPLTDRTLWYWFPFKAVRHVEGGIQFIADNDARLMKIGALRRYRQIRHKLKKRLRLKP
jgi:hypothetical protein